ncbi:MAG: hypothetical protein LH480_09380 [Rubrivivax sp.]|nr:hypothetical protein [Rubrivivax sp.]
MPALLALLLVLLFVMFVLWRALHRAKQAEFIRRQPLPPGLYDELRVRHPQLALKDCQIVSQALRQFFLAYLKGGLKPVSMPSQVADDLWHDFILHTRAHQIFCAGAFGRFLHHTPAASLSKLEDSNAGLRRCWWHCCRADNIDPSRPTRLPLLFAIDKKLAIAGGFVYAADCTALETSAVRDGSGCVIVHCGDDFSSSSIDGSMDGFGNGGSDCDGGGDGGDGGGGD